MVDSLKGFFRAGRREHLFCSDHPLDYAPHSHDAALEPEKTMMPSARKCYIVLRATLMWRKDAL
jgi:hypothetical protein